MGRNERIGLLAAAVVVLAIGFIFISGGGDEGDGERQAATRTTPAQTQAGETQQDAPPQAPQAPAPRVERVRIRDGGPVGDPRTLEYESGETVRLRFRSNQASEIHIHGYDKYVDVPAGGTAAARFEADAEGVFEIEDHGTGQIVAKLEVSP